MKKVRLLLLVVIIFSAFKQVSSQPIAFRRVDSIPVVSGGVTLNNAWAGGINFPMFSEIDLNGDGIHDLFYYDIDNGRISTFINDGSAGTSCWHYAPEYISKFPHINSWAYLVDYN